VVAVCSLLHQVAVQAHELPDRAQLGRTGQQLRDAVPALQQVRHPARRLLLTEANGMVAPSRHGI
jgi:hypothetical protein